MPSAGHITTKNEFSTLKIGRKDIFSSFAKSKVSDLFLFFTSNDVKWQKRHKNGANSYKNNS